MHLGLYFERINQGFLRINASSLCHLAKLNELPQRTRARRKLRAARPDQSLDFRPIGQKAKARNIRHAPPGFFRQSIYFVTEALRDSKVNRGSLFFSGAHAMYAM